MSVKNVGCPHCGSVVSFEIDGDEVTSVKGLREGTDLDRFDGFGYSTEYKECPSCGGKIAVHYKDASDDMGAQSDTGSGQKTDG